MASPGYFDDAVEKVEADPDAAEDFDFDAPEAPLPTGRGASEEMERYFAELERRMRVEYELARRCRERGIDPETRVEIPPAIDLAARVEELVGPKGVAARIRELAKEKNREELSLVVAKEVAAGKFGAPGALSLAASNDPKTQALDQAIRTGLAILTEGILVAPLEGIAGVRVLKNEDGSDCAAISFAGPIRAAGGTGQALSVLIADVVRRELGIGKYVATEREIARMKEEIPAYKQAANLQYKPSNEEIELIMRNCPVMIDGEGTEKEEVGGNRDLPRIETNQLRGGACLVLAEGMTQKAPKIQKNVKSLRLDGWQFIDQVIEYVKKSQSKGGEGGGKKFTDPWAKELEAAPAPLEPSKKFMDDLIAGRPVFAHPSRKGGWRLRYGRARTGGLATTAIHPAAMALTDDFLAPGTQMKIERPGKATACTPCDTIDPPIALLANGTLVEVTSYKHGKQLRPIVSRIVDLGEILVPYGEFAENNKTLPRSPWCEEWWAQLVERTIGQVPVLHTARDAFAFAEKTATPLHPRWNLFWHDVGLDDLLRLSRFIETHGRWEETEDGTLVLPKAHEEKEILVELGALHEVHGNDVRVGRHSYALVRCLGLDVNAGRIVRLRALQGPHVDGIAGSCPYVSAMSGVKIQPRALYRIGTRMGRPEKAAERKMNPPVHLLFPIGNSGGPQRLLSDAGKAGNVEVEIAERACPQCRAVSFLYRCEQCGAHTEPRPEDRVAPKPVPVGQLFQQAIERLKMDKAPETVKGVQGLISRAKAPEPMEKGILRAKHNLFTFKDGTVRFDMINVNLTHFKPREANVTVAKLREMGYAKDIHGAPLERDDQVLELRVQDIIVSTLCMDYMLRASQYVDDLLVKVYGYKPYYNCKTKEDLLGHLFVALAPHTSGGVLCRIVGHNRAQAHYGHPYFHASKRRNCVPADTQIWIRDGDGPRRVQIGDLVERAFEGRVPRPLDNYGTEAVALSGPLEAYTLDPATLRPRRLRITKAIRGQTDTWVRISTRGGRIFVCTPDHSILTREAGGWVVKAAEKVAPGDHFPAALAAPDAGVTTPSVSTDARANEWFGLDEVAGVEVIASPGRTYCIDVDSGSDDPSTKNVLWGSGLYQIRCDGDEDCVMLLMDGLLNFSRAYLPSNRGGLMDAPLTLTMRIDPSEVDKEAHNVDVMWRYPLEFYEATEQHPGPKDVEKIMERVADRLGKPSQYEGFGFTHDTVDVADGPPMSAYKTIGSMMEKMEAQLDLAARIRAVDAPDVAARVLGSHFLPDLMGNLKAFSKQGMRCTKCSAKYRRIPLSGKCRKCGNATLTMTVYEASVKKYLEVSKAISERFEIDDYTKQRIEHIADSIESTFQNDRVKKAKLSDFF